MLNEASPTLFQLTQAFVGLEAGVAFNDFVKNYDRQITIEDVLMGKATEMANNFTEVEHLALVQKLENCEELKSKMTDDQIKNIFKYMMIVPSEVFMPLWSAIGKLCQENAVKLHGQVVDGVPFKDLLIERLTGKSVVK